VFTVSPILGLYSLVVLAIFGMAIAAIAEWLGSLIMKSGTGGVIKDSFLRSFGYFGIVLPVLHEWYRSRRKHTVTDR